MRKSIFTCILILNTGCFKTVLVICMIFLAVGLSVTCSTTTDDSYCKNEPYALHHEVASMYSSLINYTPENIPPSNESSMHNPGFNFNQSFIQSELGNSFTQSENLESDDGGFVSLDSYELGKNKIDLSRSRVENIKSSSHILLKNEHSESHKMQVCQTCGKTFKFQTSLLRHNNKVHFSRYQCSACCRVFSRQSYLDVHTSKPGTSCFIQHKIKSKRRKRKHSCL